MKINEMIENVKSKQDFISFINRLSNDNQINNDEWENKDILSYFEGVSSWVEDMDGYYKYMKLDVPTNIDWRFIATLFYVGKIYE